MNIKTACCLGDIVQGTTKEYPLGDRFSINYATEICGTCGKEAEPVECCDCCGESGLPLRKTMLGDWCKPCVVEEVELRIRELKKEWGLITA